MSVDAKMQKEQGGGVMPIALATQFGAINLLLSGYSHLCDEAMSDTIRR